MRLVLHRPEAFVSSCRTSLSSRVTCVAIEPILTSQTGEFAAMRPAFRMQPQSNMSQMARFPSRQDALESSRGKACPVSWVFPRTGRYCFNLIIQRVRRDWTQEGRSPLRYCSHGRPSTYFTFRETYRPLCASSLSSPGIPTLTCGSRWPPIEVSVCRSLCSSSPMLGLPRCPCIDEIEWEGG